jgi:hypothetical protein
MGGEPPLVFGDAVHRAEDLHDVALGLPAVAVPALLAEQPEARDEGSMEALSVAVASLAVALGDGVIERERVADAPVDFVLLARQHLGDALAVVVHPPLARGEADASAG